MIEFSEFPRSRPGFELWPTESSLWYVLCIPTLNSVTNPGQDWAPVKYLQDRAIYLSLQVTKKLKLGGSLS